MYENRVEKDKKIFEIPALLSCKRENSAENGVGKFKICTYVILNFHTQDFLARNMKEWEFQKNILSFFTLFLYIPGLIHIQKKTHYKNSLR